MRRVHRAAAAFHGRSVLHADHSVGVYGQRRWTRDRLRSCPPRSDADFGSVAGYVHSTKAWQNGGVCAAASVVTAGAGGGQAVTFHKVTCHWCVCQVKERDSVPTNASTTLLSCGQGADGLLHCCRTAFTAVVFWLHSSRHQRKPSPLLCWLHSSRHQHKPSPLLCWLHSYRQQHKLSPLLCWLHSSRHQRKPSPLMCWLHSTERLRVWSHFK